MQGNRGGIFETQFATRATPACQRSVNDKLGLYMLSVGDNYTRHNWFVDLDAAAEPAAVRGYVAREVGYVFMLSAAKRKVILEECNWDSWKSESQ